MGGNSSTQAKDNVDEESKQAAAPAVASENPEADSSAVAAPSAPVAEESANVEQLTNKQPEDVAELPATSNPPVKIEVMELQGKLQEAQEAAETSQAEA
eukprot:2820013-Amphidinium_carterae.1